MPNDTADRISLFVPFARVDADKREVWGYASTEALAHDGRIITFEASQDAFSGWMPWGNVREQHDPKKAVGRAVGWKVDDDQRRIYVGSRVSVGAEDTWQKVVDGTLRGYSIGGAILERETRMVHGEDGVERSVPHVTKYVIDELSLVDRPSDPGAVFTQIIRSADISTSLTADPATETVLLDNGDRLDISGSIERGEPDDLDFGAAENIGHEDSPVAIVRADGNHDNFTGTHSHAHPTNGDQGDDETHAHEHTHDGDADHGHVHRSAPPLNFGGTSPAEALQRLRQMEAEAEALVRVAATQPAVTETVTRATATDVVVTGIAADGGPLTAARLDHTHPSTGAVVPTIRRDATTQDWQCLKCEATLERADVNFCPMCGAAIVQPEPEAVAADPSDEAGDMAAIQAAYKIVAQLLAKEAGEVASGEAGDAWDAQLLADVAGKLQTLMQSEAWELGQEALEMSRADVVALRQQVEELTRAREADAAALGTLTTEVASLRDERVQRSADTSAEERLLALEGRLVSLEAQPLPGPVSRATVAVDRILPGDSNTPRTPSDTHEAWEVLRSAAEKLDPELADKLGAVQAELDIREIQRSAPMSIARG